MPATSKQASKQTNIQANQQTNQQTDKQTNKTYYVKIKNKKIKKSNYQQMLIKINKRRVTINRSTYGQGLRVVET